MLYAVCVGIETIRAGSATRLATDKIKRLLAGFGRRFDHAHSVVTRRSPRSSVQGVSQ